MPEDLTEKEAMRVARFVQSLALSSDQPAITAGKRSSCSPLRSSGKQRATALDITTGAVIAAGVLLVVLIILMVVGFRW